MAGINKAIIIGNLGADPEYRAFQDGTGITTFSVATSESWKDRNTGEPQERTEWHRIVARGKLADICRQYLAKGSKVYIEGPLRTRKYQAKDGSDRYTTEIVIGGFGSSMQMLDSRNAGGGQGPRTQAPSQGNQSQGTASPGDWQGPDGPAFDDDIPF
jgi:single-strand DNA-binding protein